MKIILPVSDQINGIAQSFHNTELACIYNYASKSCEWIPTKSISAGSGNLAEGLKKIGICAVISTQMPLMALGFFTDIGLKVYQAVGENIDENIRMFAANQLKQLTNASAKSSAACSGSCSACKTSCNT